MSMRSFFDRRWEIVEHPAHHGEFARPNMVRRGGDKSQLFDHLSTHRSSRFSWRFGDSL
jgi:hypothetical protein